MNVFCPTVNIRVRCFYHLCALLQAAVRVPLFDEDGDPVSFSSSLCIRPRSFSEFQRRVLYVASVLGMVQGPMYAAMMGRPAVGWSIQGAVVIYISASQCQLR
jgi:hypothetical protein